MSDALTVKVKLRIDELKSKISVCMRKTEKKKAQLKRLEEKQLKRENRLRAMQKTLDELVTIYNSYYPIDEVNRYCRKRYEPETN